MTAQVNLSVCFRLSVAADVRAWQTDRWLVDSEVDCGWVRAQNDPFFSGLYMNERRNSWDEHHHPFRQTDGIEPSLHYKIRITSSPCLREIPIYKPQPFSFGRNWPQNIIYEALFHHFLSARLVKRHYHRVCESMSHWQTCSPWL